MSDIPQRVFLVELSYKNEIDGTMKNFGLEVVGGNILGVGDLEPDRAALIFFDVIKKQAGEEFMKMAANKFNGEP